MHSLQFLIFNNDSKVHESDKEEGVHTRGRADPQTLIHLEFDRGTAKRMGTNLLRALSASSSGLLRAGVILDRRIGMAGEERRGEAEDTGLRPVGLPCSSRSRANMAVPLDAVAALAAGTAAGARRVRGGGGGSAGIQIYKTMVMCLQMKRECEC